MVYTSKPDPVFDQLTLILVCDADLKHPRPLGVSSSESYAPSPRYDRPWLRCISDNELAETTRLALKDGQIQLPSACQGSSGPAEEPQTIHMHGLIEQLGGIEFKGRSFTRTDFVGQQTVLDIFFPGEEDEDDTGGPSTQ